MIRLTRVHGDGLLPSLHGHYPASSLLRSSPPLTGASVLLASRLAPLVPFPLASPCRFSRSVRKPGRTSRRLHAGNERASAGSGGIGRGCTTLSGCTTAIECDATDRKLPQRDRSHKSWNEA